LNHYSTIKIYLILGVLAMLKLKLAAVIFICGFSSAALIGSAQATVISQSDLTDGLSTQVVGDFTISTSGNTGPGFFGHKTINGVTGVGVNGSGSVVDAEIDNQESITFASAIAHNLNAFTVAFLNAAPAFGDTVNEFSLLNVVNGLTTGYTIEVTDPTHADVVCSGPNCVGVTLTNLSPGNDSGGGEWNVSFNTPATFQSLIFQPADG